METVRQEFYENSERKRLKSISNIFTIKMKLCNMINKGEEYS